MAKAKKQETTEKSGGAGGTKKKTAPAKAAPRKPAASPAGGMPLIDTDLAASAAASMVLNRAVTGTAPTDGGPRPAAEPADKRETSTFKQLKQNLAKPAAGGLGGVLGGAQAGKKSSQPFGGGNQVGRNQTFGTNASRTNVPRRTGG